LTPGCLPFWSLQDDRDLTTNIQPSPQEYAWGSGIETLRILESAAKLIPVPFLKDIINLALNVLLACEVGQFLNLPHSVLINFH